MRRDSGFTLTELLVTLGIVSVLAVIAVPQLMRARLTSNEASAIASLRAISSSQANYAATCGSGGYATDLADLAKAPPSSTHGFLSPDLGTNGVTKSGYTFTVARNGSADTADITALTCNGAATTRASSFFAGAVPVMVGVTGSRHFATDTPGTIFVDPAPIPNPIPPGTATVQE